MVVVNGTDHETLKKGPGRDLGSAMPGEGRLVYIAGHRTTYLAPFSHIDTSAKATASRLEMPYATFVYRVTRHRIVPRNDLRAALAEPRAARAAGVPPALLRDAPLHRLRAARLVDPRGMRPYRSRRRGRLRARSERAEPEASRRGLPAASSPSPRGTRTSASAAAERTIMCDSWPMIGSGRGRRRWPSGPHQRADEVVPGTVRRAGPGARLLEARERTAQTLKGAHRRAHEEPQPTNDETGLPGKPKTVSLRAPRRRPASPA